MRLIVALKHQFAVILKNIGVQPTPRHANAKRVLRAMRDEPAACQPRPGEHWIVGNIPGRVLATGYRERNGETDIEGVQILEPYRYPHIPGVSDRYGLFVFEQPERIVFESLSASIINFDYRAFIDKYRLGQPVASNYFVAVYTSVSPFSGKPFHGNDVEDTWHRNLGEGELVQ